MISVFKTLSWKLAFVGLLFSYMSCDEPTKPDTTPPTVNITYPATGSILTGVVVITAEATDNKEVSHVEFYVDGQLKSTDLVKPWAYSWNTDEYADGNAHTLFAKAYDSANNEGLSSVVTITIPAPEPLLSVTPTSLDFGETESHKTFTITNSGGETLTWSITDSQEWITVSPISGTTTTETEQITVTLNKSALTPGSYNGTITITSNGGDAILTVATAVLAPALSVTPTSLDFGETESQKTFSIANSGGMTLTWNLTDDQEWITVSPTSGTTSTETDQLTVTVNRGGLTPGPYNGTITITSNGGDATLTVATSVPAPALSVTPISLSFGETESQKTFAVSNSGGATLTWSITNDQEWITVSPTSGTTTSESDQITVNINRGGLTPGSYSGMITVTSNGGSAFITTSMTVAAITIGVTNYLVNAIDVSVNGNNIGSVSAGQTGQFEIAPPTSMQVSWSLIRTTTTSGTPIGDDMSGNFSTVNNPAGSYNYTVDNILGDNWYFAPFITNNTSVGLLMAVNWELQSENRCNCVVPANTANVRLGYYRFYSNTKVVAFLTSTGYSGSYLFWEYGNQFTTEDLEENSGRLDLFTGTTPPSAPPSIEGILAGSTQPDLKIPYISLDKDIRQNQPLDAH